MWNTNQELMNRIIALEKKVETLIQVKEPQFWRYEWQIWYDKVSQSTKVWNWQEFQSMWDLKPVIVEVVIPSGTVVWDYNLTSSKIWFTPTLIRIQANINLWDLAWISDIQYDWTDIWWVRWYNNTSWKDTWQDSENTQIIHTSCDDWATIYRFKATPVNFINWGIKINIWTTTTIDDITCIITAYQ